MKSQLIFYIDMDNVITDYSNFNRQKLLEIPTQPYPDNQYNFFAGIPPINDATEGVKTIIGDVLIDDQVREKSQDKFDVLLIQFGSADYPHWQNVLEKREHLKEGM